MLAEPIFQRVKGIQLYTVLGHMHNLFVALNLNKLVLMSQIIEAIKQEKLKLEESISARITEFEKTWGVEISNIQLAHGWDEATPEDISAEVKFTIQI